MKGCVLRLTDMRTVTATRDGSLRNLETQARTTSGLLFRVDSWPRYTVNATPLGSSAISQSYGSRLQPVNTSMKVQPSMNTSLASVTTMPPDRGTNVSQARHASGATSLVYWLADKTETIQKNAESEAAVRLETSMRGRHNDNWTR